MQTRIGKGNPYGSHQHILIKILPKIDNDIVEFGVGIFSTPVFYNHVFKYNGFFLAFETDASYVSQFKSYECDNFKIIHVKNWNDVYNNDMLDKSWNLVFVDQHPWEPRLVTIQKMIDKCDYLILHDAQHLKERPFKYLKEFGAGTAEEPSTLICSNFKSIPDIMA